MDFIEREAPGFTIIDLDGRLTAAVAPRLRTAVDELLARGRTRVAVNLAGISFIDSSGLGALVGSLKATQAAGGDLRIAAAPEQVRQVLRLTNLDRVLHSYETAERAFDD